MVGTADYVLHGTEGLGRQWASGNALYMHNGYLVDKGIPMLDKGLRRQIWTTLHVRLIIAVPNSTE